jgi:hypothetical protein
MAPVWMEGGAMEEFEAIFEDLADPRTGNAKRHELLEILAIALCTVLSGGETCADMALFGRSKWACRKVCQQAENRADGHGFQAGFPSEGPIRSNHFRGHFQSLRQAPRATR